MRHQKIGLLIASMGRMVHDVGQFCILYSVFLLRFSGAFHLILGESDGYETYLDSFIMVLLMIFGNLTYDPFGNAMGFQCAFANLLLLVYLIYAVIMLLNVLIALMSTSLTNITETAQDQYSLHLAEIILRIERPLSRSARDKIFKWLIPDEEVTVLRALTNDGKSIIDMPNGGGQQQAIGKVKPLGNMPKDGVLNTNTRATYTNAMYVLKELEDGIRNEWSQPTKESAREERFERIGTQIREFSSIIMELQGQQKLQISIILKLQSQLECSIPYPSVASSISLPDLKQVESVSSSDQHNNCGTSLHDVQ